MNEKKWGYKITPIRILLLLFVMFAVVVILFRYATGLGYSTNLNDSWPWGLWIGCDLTAVALAGAGYSICLLAHVLNIKDFGPYARRGLLISLLAYVFVLATLIVEIGRPDNFWRPLVNWGHASPMFEVYIAIVIYMFIQAAEFSEIVTEKIFKGANKIIKFFLPVVFIIGALIPFGHQASLGAIYLVVPHKLNALWYTPMLPWFFLISSFYAGPAMITLDTLWSKKIFKSQMHMESLRKLIRVSGTLMIIHFVWKFIDLARLGNLGSVFTGTLEANLFLVEMIIGILIPALICFSSWSSSKSGLATFSLLTIFGVALSRVNVVFTGMHKALGSGYFPNWVEWVIALGLLSAMVLVYTAIVENFAIFSKDRPSDKTVVGQTGVTATE